MADTKETVVETLKEETKMVEETVKEEKSTDAKTVKEEKSTDAETGKVEELTAKTTEENGHIKKENGAEAAEESKKVENNPELFKKIVTQIEYYFGNYNLPRDKFLSAEVKKDDGWVALTTMLKFARLAKLSTHLKTISAAIRDAKDSFMEVDDADTKIRRSVDVPLPELSEGMMEESIKRTIYCKGFPKDGSVDLDGLFEFFRPFGEFDSVRMRNYADKGTNAKGFKGSVLVVFKTPELAKAFIEGPPTQYQKTYLIKKWFGIYLDEKKQEMEERKAKKAARLEETSSNGAEKMAEDLPKGIFLKATGFTDTTTREDIKAAIFDLTNDCAFVDFRKGETEAYVRFSEAGSNVQMLAALKDTLKVNENKIEVSMVEGDEETAQLEKANEARKRSFSNSNQKKRRGGYSSRGGRKRQRTN